MTGSKRNPNLWYYRTPLLYLGTIVLFGGLGLVSAMPLNKRNLLKAVELNTEEVADEVFEVDVWQPTRDFLAFEDGMVMVTESQLTGPAIRYWCRRAYNQWGVVDYDFPLSPLRMVEKVVLEHRTMTFGALDARAEAEIWLPSPRVERLEQVGHLAGTAIVSFPQTLDVTEHASGKSHFRLRYRLRASQLLFHPTPDVPIGYAAAQACRSVQGTGPVLKLHIWYKEDLEK
jgi:hypothetical protein